jgi:hypothetical protein
MRRIPIAAAVGAHPDCGKYKHLFGADAVPTSDLAAIGGGAAGDAMMRRIPVAAGIAVGAHPDCGKYKHLFGADAASTSDLAVIGGGAAGDATVRRWGLVFSSVGGCSNIGGVGDIFSPW